MKVNKNQTRILLFLIPDQTEICLLLFILICLLLFILSKESFCYFRFITFVFRKFYAKKRFQFKTLLIPEMQLDNSKKSILFLVGLVVAYSYFFCWLGSFVIQAWLENLTFQILNQVTLI